MLKELVDMYVHVFFNFNGTVGPLLQSSNNIYTQSTGNLIVTAAIYSIPLIQRLRYRIGTL